MRNEATSLIAALALATGCDAAGQLGRPSDGTEKPQVHEVDTNDFAAPAYQLEATVGHGVSTEIDGTDGRFYEPPPPIDRDILSHLATGQTQLDLVCARGDDNAVTRVFCGPNPPSITSLTDLQDALGIGFVNPQGGNDQGGNPAFAITGHSTSLVTRSVSAMNPRTIVFTQDRNHRDDGELVILGFTRGDQFAEIIVDPGPNQDLQFYLLKFKQACNDGTNGCNWGDLLLPGAETNWTSWTLYQDEDLKNSVLDCRQCHQPDGPGTPKILRMQELRNPWTHWFRDNRDGGRALIADFQGAHGTDEDYGGVPAALISESDPANLEDLVELAGFEDQPNLFITSDIEDEVVDSNDAQPDTNMPPGQSTTWEALYAEAVAGNMIPVPYHDVKVSDPGKLAAMSAEYIAVKNGTKPASELPDVREVFLDSALPKLSMRPAEGLDGRGILVHMCGQCHNAKLDQTISRANFNVFALDSMSREMKEKAVRRLRMDSESRYKMPPTLFREMSDEEIAKAVAELRK